MNDVKRLVREFCVKKLAGILFECVQCSSSDRAALDWHTAEGIVDRHTMLIETMTPQFAMCGWARTYETFERLFGTYLWGKRWEFIREQKLPHPYVT